MVLGRFEQLELWVDAPVSRVVVVRELIAFSLFVYELVFAGVLHVEQSDVPARDTALILLLVLGLLHSVGRCVIRLITAGPVALLAIHFLLRV